jgi:hypothetical protein
VVTVGLGHPSDRRQTPEVALTRRPRAGQSGARLTARAAWRNAANKPVRSAVPLSWDGAGAPGGASPRLSPARGAPDAALRSGAALIEKYLMTISAMTGLKG